MAARVWDIARAAFYQMATKSMPLVAWSSDGNLRRSKKVTD